MSDTETPKTWSHCNACSHETEHYILKEHQQYDEEGPNFLHEFLKCCGCHRISMRITSPYSSNETKYPPAISRPIPSWATDYDIYDLIDEKPPVPKTISALIVETYTAVQSGSNRLVAMGVRAVLDAIISEKLGDVGSFKAGLDGLLKAGYISSRQQMMIDSVLEAGHAAIHRGWFPSGRDIEILLDVLESLIETVYVHEGRAQELEKRVPKRVVRSKKPI